MSVFYIIPPRKIVGGDGGGLSVTSLNDLQGDLILGATNGLTLSVMGQSLIFSVVPNTFVLRAGDTMTGNLQFSASAGVYGVRLLDLAADPAATDRGAIYYNWQQNVLKLYNGTAWETLAQTGALTGAVADTTYLRLDATNAPMQGDLTLGTGIKLGLGQFTTSPTGGTSGQIIYNTTTSSVQVYSSGNWVNVGAGVKSVGAGVGLVVDGAGANPITSIGVLDVDQTYPFNWSGNQTFTGTATLTFSASQQLPINLFYASSQAIGDMVSRSASGWGRLGIGTLGQILTVAQSGANLVPQWGAPVGGTIGTPDNGDNYPTGFFTAWTSSTTVADAFDNVNQILAVLAPAQGNALTGASLTIAAPTVYSAIVSNLTGATATAWYQNGVVAGSTIATYIPATSAAFTFTTPNTTTTFCCGTANKPATYGTLYHNLYTGGVLNQISYAMSAGLGTSGTSPRVLALTALATYPTAQPIWEIGTGRVTFTQTSDGCAGHEISHTQAGTTNRVYYWLDTAAGGTPTPSFVAAKQVITPATPVYMYLSGVQYYANGSTFTVQFMATGGAGGIYDRCYHPTHVAQITLPACMNAITVNPTGIPNNTDQLDRYSSPVTATLNIAGNAIPKGTAFTITLYKPSGTTATATLTPTYGYNTYGTVSTGVQEYFLDEAQRVVLGTNTAWSSATALVTGNAQVRVIGTNVGSLQYPSSTDGYSFTGPQEYQRIIAIASRSTGTITFNSGFNISNIAAYGTGNLNILIALDYSGVWFDMGVLVGTGTPTGTSRSTAFGGRAAGSSGAVLNFSFGTYTTDSGSSTNQGKFRLVIIFNNSSASSISSLAVS